MEKVVVDADLRAKLTGLREEAMIAGPSGDTLGYFVPPEQFEQMLTAWLDREPTEEERQAAREEYRTTGGFTTAEAIEIVRTGKWPDGGGR